LTKHYTVQEANDKLPELQRLLEEMQQLGQQLATVRQRQAEIEMKMRSNGHQHPAEDQLVGQSAQGVEEALRTGLEQLAEWNIELKDLQLGLVDFPAVLEGRTVYLCWQLGEPEVAFWHETTTGFAGRQPLNDRFP
jgi:hypothetical protein